MKLHELKFYEPKFCLNEMFGTKADIKWVQVRSKHPRETRMKLLPLLEFGINGVFPLLFHGTTAKVARQLIQQGFDQRDVYLTDSYEDAAGYAHGLHLGGSKTSEKEKIRILKIRARPGKTLWADNEVQQIITDEHETFRDLDDLTSHAKSQGYRYIHYEHPSFGFGDKDMHDVVISLHPHEDLKIL